MIILNNIIHTTAHFKYIIIHPRCYYDHVFYEHKISISDNISIFLSSVIKRNNIQVSNTESKISIEKHWSPEFDLTDGNFKEIINRYKKLTVFY